VKLSNREWRNGGRLCWRGNQLEASLEKRGGQRCTCLAGAFQKEFGSMREKEPGRRANSANSLVEPVVVLSAAWIRHVGR